MAADVLLALPEFPHVVDQDSNMGQTASTTQGTKQEDDDDDGDDKDGEDAHDAAPRVQSPSPTHDEHVHMKANPLVIPLSKEVLPDEIGHRERDEIHHLAKYAAAEEVMRPVGERVDHIPRYVRNQPSNPREDEVPTEIAGDSVANITNPSTILSWAAKRKMFGTVYGHENRSTTCAGSLSSEFSSLSGSLSVSSFLHARQFDAMELLVNLGFGEPDIHLNVPDRFLTASSHIQGTESDWMRTADEDEDDIFESAGSTSYSSSWSDRNNLFDCLPSRFIPTTSSLGSMSDLTDSEDLDKTVLPVLVILEPEEAADDSFDLMRHLRLNRVQQKPTQGGLFLEPVTEELEVSSVGSGSVRTKISVKQESLDSLGTISVLTKISRKQESVDSVNDKMIWEQQEDCAPQEAGHEPSAEPRNEGCLTTWGNNGDVPFGNQVNEKENQDMEEQINTSCLSDLNKSTVVISEACSPSSLADSESGIGSAYDQESISIRVPSLKRPYLESLVANEVQESFELEEIATEENYDSTVESERRRSVTERHGGNSLGIHAGKVKQVKRQYSDESSGFEDEVVQDKNKKISSDTPTLQSIESNTSCAKRKLFDGSLKVPTLDHDSLEEDKICVPERNANQTSEVHGRRTAFAKRRSWSATKQLRVAFEDEVAIKPKSHSFDGYMDTDITHHMLDLQSLQAPSRNADVAPSVVNASKRNHTSVAKSPFSDSRKHRIRTPSEKTAVDNIRSFITGLWSSKHKKPTAEDDYRSSESKAVAGSSISIRVNAAEDEDKTVLDPVMKLQPGVCEGGTRNEGVTKLEEDQQSPENLRHSLVEVDVAEERMHQYRTAFFAMEPISTVQHGYYTEKLLARLAWDVDMIRKLRNLIKVQLDKIQQNLEERRRYLLGNLTDERLPLGVSERMASLLIHQSSLYQHLMQLSTDVPHHTWCNQASSIGQTAATQQAINRKELEHQIKTSILEELGQKLFLQIDEIRQEVRAKDAIIDDLRIKVESMQGRG